MSGKQRLNVDAGGNANWLKKLAWDLPTDPEAFVTFAILQGYDQQWVEQQMSNPLMPQPLKDGLVKLGLKASSDDSSGSGK